MDLLQLVYTFSPYQPIRCRFWTLLTDRYPINTSGRSDWEYKWFSWKLSFGFYGNRFFLFLYERRILDTVKRPQMDIFSSKMSSVLFHGFAWHKEKKIIYHIYAIFIIFIALQKNVRILNIYTHIYKILLSLLKKYGMAV